MSYRFLSLNPMKDGIVNRIKNYKNNKEVSKLSVWVKITSGAGFTIVSNPNIPTFGVNSIHGSLGGSATIGQKNFDGAPSNPLNVGGGIGYTPRPTIDSIEITYGNNALSRKASFDINCFTKEQADELSKYFSEPGFHVSIEWGWNIAESYAQLSKDVTAIAELQNFKKLEEKRLDSNFTYEAYLGIITGGSLSYNDTTTKLSVSLTGIGEVMSELQSNSGVESKDGEGDKKKTDIRIRKTDFRGEDKINESFIEMYNSLPASIRTERLAQGVRDITGGDVLNENNYINFVEDIRDGLNKVSRERGAIARFFGKGKVENADGKKVNIPSGDGIVDTNRYINFGTLVKIINSISSINYPEGIELKGGEKLKLSINIEDVPISAFPEIFSTNGNRLYIPTSRPLDFGLRQSFDDTNPNTLVGSNFAKNGEGGNANFAPPLGPQTDFRPDERNRSSFPSPKGLSDDRFNADEYKWGYLEDLYIDFDFAVSILDRSGGTQRSIMLDLLNGMSSAVNNLWDFALTEDVDKNDIIIIGVVDQNFLGFKKNEPPVFVGRGEQSSFLSFGLDIDMPKAMMSQIMAKRLTSTTTEEIGDGSDTSPALPFVPSSFFSTDLRDQVAEKIETFKTSSITAPGEDTRTGDMVIKENFEYFTKTGTIIHDITSDDVTIGDESLFKHCFVGAWNDKTLLTHFKSKNDKPGGLSPLLPIKSSFTTLGVSGIVFGDIYKIIDLPEKYTGKGLFQVVELSHTISGMNWTTSVTGQYRQTE